MIDRPDAETLLVAMAEALTRDVLPATKGAATHTARVVANLCSVLAREAQLGDAARTATRGALAELLGRHDALPELVRALDERLREGDPTFEAEAHAVLLADVRRRLAIDKPGYDA